MVEKTEEKVEEDLTVTTGILKSEQVLTKGERGGGRRPLCKKQQVQKLGGVT